MKLETIISFVHHKSRYLYIALDEQKKKPERSRSTRKEGRRGPRAKHTRQEENQKPEGDEVNEHAGGGKDRAGPSECQ